MSASPAQTSRSLLRSADFLKLWVGQTVSVFGTQITVLAIPTVAALTLKVAPFEFGLIETLEFLPFILLSLQAGVWVDRLRRRPILIVADLARAVSLLSIPIAFALGALTIWQLYLVVFVNGCLTVFFDVAYQSYLPSIVERDQVVEGNSRLELTRTAAARLGPGAAGVLIGIVTAPFAILLDGLSYVLSAVLLTWIRRPEPAPTAHDASTGPRPSVRQEVAVGLRYVIGHQWLRAIALASNLSNLFGSVANALLILYLLTERQFTPALVGFAFSIGSLGVFAAALVTSRLTKRLGVGPMLLLCSFGFSVSWVPVPLAPDALLFPALSLSIVALGFFGVAWNINQVSLRQAITPHDLLGKMNATMRFIAWGAIPIGTLAGGFLGGVIGLHDTIWVGAIGSCISFVPVAFSSVRRLRQIPDAILP
ncbi:MAG: MFS transporter [Candidatus Limnocylindrales bacterium]